MNIKNMIKIGSYSYAKELHNGKWSLYVGRYSPQGPHYVTELEVYRDSGVPLRFTSLEKVKIFCASKAL